MKVEPNYCSMETVFGENTIFKVPKYQRAYSWEKGNVQVFCDDIYSLYERKKLTQNVSQHFLGGIVCVRIENEDDLDEKVVYQLVDGQQRLSTTSLLVARIKHFIESLRLDENLSDLRTKRLKKYTSKFINVVTEENGKDIHFPRISLSKRDDYFYQELLQGNTHNPDKKSHQLLKNSSKEIDQWLKKFRGNNEAETLDNIDLLYRVLCKSCKILLLKMVNVSDAYKLFQVINDRGRSLTASDLLRASSLGAVDNADFGEPEIEALEEKWDAITSAGSQHTDNNLIDYYVSKTGKQNKKSNLFETFNERFFSNPEFIPDEIEILESQLKKLKLLSSGKWPYANSSLSNYQKDKLNNLVNRLKHTHCLPLLLSATQLKENKFYQLIFFLEKFFFLFKVCLNKRMTSVTKIYNRTIHRVNHSPDKFQVKWFTDELKLIIEKLSLNEINMALSNINYVDDEDNRNLKFVLCAIEESWAWSSKGFKNSYVGLYKNHIKNLSDFSVYSIEHIYPRKAREQDLDADLEQSKNEIGNLTLLYPQENSECGNKLILDKKESYEQSRVNLSRVLSPLDSFTLDDKVAREVELKKAAMMILTLGFKDKERVDEVFK